MLFLIAFVLSLVIAFAGKKAIKAHPAVFYIAAAVITTVIVALKQSDISISSDFVNKYLIGIFAKGAFAGAMWSVVMWAGALTTDNALGKKFVSTVMPIRGELSIMAAIVSACHGIVYGIIYLKRFNNFRKLDLSFTADFVLTCLIGLVIIAIMTPLTIMSIKAVRRKMNAKVWKNIQRAAYVFYALILANILVVYIPRSREGSTEAYLSILTYSLVFVGYGVMRVRKAIITKKKTENRLLLNVVCGVIFAALMAIIAIFSYGTAPKESSEQGTVTTTHTIVTLAPTEDTVTVTTVTGASTVTTTSADTTATTSSGDTGTTTTTTTDANATTTTLAEGETEAPTEEQPEESAQAEQQAEESPQQAEAQAPAQAEQQTAAAAAPTEAPAAAATEPVNNSVFNDGTYTGVGVSPADDEGKDNKGNVYATITISGDIITSISISYDATEDADYIAMAEGAVLGKVLGASSTDGADAQCGATRTATGIIKAINNALDKARR